MQDITPGTTAPCCDYFPDLPAWLTLESSQDTTLVFESRFECGNLRRVVQVGACAGVRCLSAAIHSCSTNMFWQYCCSTGAATWLRKLAILLSAVGSKHCCLNRRIFLHPQVFDNEYDLILQPDLNTRAHTQWFYFAISNTRAGVPYKFNIINLMKDDSLYNQGMLPLVHSEKTLATTVSCKVTCDIYSNNSWQALAA